MSGLAALARFARDRATLVERCDLCNVVVGPRHDHVVDPSGAIRCACIACPAPRGWTRVAPRCDRVTPPSDAAWAGLDVPVSVAFVMRTNETYVVRYPSPAGMAQGAPSSAAWDALVADSPVVAELAPDIEAILVDRSRMRAYRVSIDVTYELAGLLRARGDLAAFFASLEARAC